MKIGNRLKALRTEKGFSATQVAEKLDISETTYRRYEADKTFPDIWYDLQTIKIKSTKII